LPSLLYFASLTVARRGFPGAGRVVTSGSYAFPYHLENGAPMRIVCLLILLVVLAAVIVFAVQNNEEVTLRYFDRSLTSTLPILIAVVYALGMLTGWTVIGFLRRSFRRVTERREKK
jgi:uncharacterized membrane protein YciS (DUF1049 family)